MLLPFFREFGWEATVLAVSPDQVASPIDGWLEQELPNDLEVIRVQALGLGWSRIPGLGTLDYRALGALKRAGDELLKRKHFDLVYFSTTVFGAHVLGPRWHAKFSVPFVMDYQDPWVCDYYQIHPDITPPGGRLKYALTQWLARYNEPKVIKACGGITAVSPDYPKQIKKRYPESKGLPSLVLPFPGARRDFERLAEGQPVCPIPLQDKKHMHWVYIGVAGPYMKQALSAFFNAVREWGNLNTDIINKLRIHFIGTSYAPAGQGVPIVTSLAEKYGLGELVLEQTDRIPYSQVLHWLKNADALILPGSDNPSYTASKIFPYLLAQKPLLAIFHEESSVVDLIKKAGGGTVIPFTNDEEIETIAERICTDWLNSGQYQRTLPLNDEVFEPYTDHGSAKQLCDFLHRVMNDK